MEYDRVEQARESRDHDIFLVRKRRPAEGDPVAAEQPAVLDQFRVKKTGKDEGRRPYLDEDGGERPHVGIEADLHRPIMNLAFPDGEEEIIGPIFSALPIHPDPAATSACTCYLINTSNLRYETVWTAEEWNQVPGYDTGQANAGPDAFCLLVATPAGRIYRLEKRDSDPPDAPVVDIQPVDPTSNPQLWIQLRNGCVVGRAKYQTDDGQSSVVPLVNVHSLV